jgi:serine acetyltransferase
MLRREHEYGKPVEIGSDVWIGGGALILAGVRIGSRTIIGAGSVVTRDIQDDVLAEAILAASFGRLMIKPECAHSWLSSREARSPQNERSRMGSATSLISQLSKDGSHR